MYYYISGQLVELNSGYAAIDCSGVCYRLNISMNAFSKLSAQLGKKVLLYTYLSVRDDALELYGFQDNEEHTAFVRLISVSGVGPKAGMNILSTMTAQELALAVVNNDPKAISKAPGVGNKTAQKIIIELKDKISKDFADIGGIQDSGATAPSSGSSSDAVSALVVLGYTRNEALEAVRMVDNSQPLEVIIRDALKKLVRTK